MKKNLKRVMNPQKYLTLIPEGESFCIGISNEMINTDKAKMYGLINSSEEFTSIIPNAIGTTTDYNVNGRVKPDRTKEMIKKTVEREYHIKDWHDNWHDGVCFAELPCYPRIYEEPPCISLLVNNERIVSNMYIKKESNYETTKIIMNMFLEMFGSFEVYNEQLALVPKKLKVIREPWHILPKGEYPWERAKTFLTEIIDKVPDKRRKVIEGRFEYISNFEPSCLVVGQEEFNGYVVFCFEDIRTYIFESNQINNATYVFTGEWKAASKLTKAEIIRNELCDYRIIHNEKWKEKMKQVLGV